MTRSSTELTGREPPIQDLPVFFRLQGGLGNQLFQWAAAVAFHRKTAFPVVLIAPFVPSLLSRCRRLLRHGYWTGHSELSLDYYFNVRTSPGVVIGHPLSVRNRGEIVFMPQRQELFPGYWHETFDMQLYAVQPGACVEGWLQDTRYFDFLLPEIRQMLVPRLDLRGKIERLEKTLGASLRDCIGIHVRRGDYWNFRGNLGHPQRGWVVPNSYYERACERLAADDYAAALVISNVRSAELEKDFSFLKRRVLLRTGNAALDFAILRHTGGCVIANSTFSWWAAVLNQTACSRIAAPEFFLGWWKKVWVPGGVHVEGWQWVSVE